LGSGGAEVPGIKICQRQCGQMTVRPALQGSVKLVLPHEPHWTTTNGVAGLTGSGVTSTLVGLGASCPGIGITIVVPHLGHLLMRPALLSGAFNLAAQERQMNGMGKRLPHVSSTGVQLPLIVQDGSAGGYPRRDIACGKRDRQEVAQDDCQKDFP